MIVYDATSFVLAASDMPHVTVDELTLSEIDERNKVLDVQTIFDNAPAITMIGRMHHIRVVNDKVT